MSDASAAPPAARAKREYPPSALQLDVLRRLGDGERLVFRRRVRVWALVRGTRATYPHNRSICGLLVRGFIRRRSDDEPDECVLTEKGWVALVEAGYGRTATNR